VTTYTDHNDVRGRENRLAVQAWNATRARMLATFEEYDLGCVTLYMSKTDIESRRLDGSIYRTAALCPEVLEPFSLARNFPDPREPRNEREAAKLLRAQA